MKQVDLKIDGMNCAACSSTVQTALEAVPGVERAEVAFATARASVYGEDLDIPSLEQAVASSGYEATALEEGLDPAALATEIEQRQRHHEAAWRRRAIIGWAIWIPAESLHWLAEPLGINGPWLPWLMVFASTLAMVLVGTAFIRSAISAALRRTTNMDTLIAMGASTAWGFSMWVFVAQRLGYRVDLPLYFTEAAALIALISIGHWLEARSTAKAGTAVRELLQLQPDQAEVMGEGGETSRVPTADIAEGVRILVRPGGRVPVDGTVMDGQSDVDEAIVTGEPLPVPKEPGDTVIAGSMNTSGQLVIETTVDGRHTTVARIASLVTAAQSSKADIQRLADRVSSVFVPIVLVIAAMTIIGWSLAGAAGTGIIAAVTVLVISCPCALGLATPMAVMVGAGEASLRGILIKNAASLEAAGRAVTCIFDKTGTLTLGRPIVTDIDPAPGTSPETLLATAGAVEATSEHPIAAAIVAAAKDRGITLPTVTNFQAVPGVGVRGTVENRDVSVVRDDRASCRVEVDGEIIGRLGVEDEVRPDAADAVSSLQAIGIDVQLLTGDREQTARAVAAEIGIPEEHIHAEASPEDKTQAVSAARRPSIMVGDGINDAAALAAADVGIAIASGTNVAMESASIVIPSDSVSAAAQSVHLARATLRTIKQNLFFSFFYNVAAIPLAAFGLLGPHGPLIAAAAMGLSDITVIGNAIRLKHYLRKRRISTSQWQ
jgi:Cu+-exporting ATPase